MKRLYTLSVFVIVAAAAIGCSRDAIESTVGPVVSDIAAMSYGQMLIDAAGGDPGAVFDLEVDVTPAYIRIRKGGRMTDRCYGVYHGWGGISFYRVKCSDN
jgi:hypothetical protein